MSCRGFARLGSENTGLLALVAPPAHAEEVIPLHRQTI
jgi:hypothetical protein